MSIFWFEIPFIKLLKDPVTPSFNRGDTYVSVVSPGLSLSD